MPTHVEVAGRSVPATPETTERVRGFLLPALERPETALWLFRRLLETLPDAMLVVDAAGRILFANAQAERLFEYRLEELIGENVDLIVPDRMRSAHAAHRLRYAAAPSPRAMGSGLSLFAQTRSGREFPVEISLSPVAFEDQVLISANVRDISDRRRNEHELLEARALAEAASAAKSEFLASMSHELRTPLNAVLGFAQLLQRDKKSPLSERQKDRVEHVLRGGEHLLQLIDEVLDLAKVEAGRVVMSLEPVSIGQVLSDVIGTLESMAARANIRLVIDVAGTDPGEVIADRTRFRQILLNYGSNAIKYGRSGGSATFTVAKHESVACISVVDNGLGIPTEKQATLFQPFQRAGQETGPIEGTGIGLVITKRLAELMQGRVGFESLEGTGSRFWLELPIHRAESAPTATTSGAKTAAGGVLYGQHGPRYVVVYVEDNPSNIAFMRDLLADYERLELLTAPTAEIGVELVRARHPHVVIMDINLPGMSGFEATRKLATWPETRDIPVIALSAAAMIRDAARVAGAGFFRYLTKPVQVDELTGLLEELLVQRPSDGGSAGGSEELTESGCRCPRMDSTMAINSSTSTGLVRYR